MTFRNKNKTLIPIKKIQRYRKRIQKNIEKIWKNINGVLIDGNKQQVNYNNNQ